MALLNLGKRKFQTVLVVMQGQSVTASMVVWLYPDKPAVVRETKSIRVRDIVPMLHHFDLVLGFYMDDVQQRKADSLVREARRQNTLAGTIEVLDVKFPQYRKLSMMEVVEQGVRAFLKKHGIDFIFGTVYITEDDIYMMGPASNIILYGRLKL